MYKGVTIIKAGLGNRRDKNYYPGKTLKRAAESGQFEGLRAFVDHPDSVSEEILPERTVRDMAGIYTNTRYVESNDGARGRVVGDFRVLKAHKWLSDTIDELLEVRQADKIGISVNGSGKTHPAKMKIAEAGDEEMDVNYLDDFVNLRSADVVTEAGAGGGWTELLESARGNKREKTMKLTRKQLADLQEAAKKGDMDAVKKLTEALTAEADVQEATDKKKDKSKQKDKLKKKKVETDDDQEVEEATESDEESVEEDDPDSELEDAVEEAKDGTDPDEDDSEESDSDEDEESDDDSDDLEESDEEDDEEEDDIEESDERKKVLRAVAKQKAAKQAREAAPGYGKVQGNAVKKRAQQNSKQKGRGFPAKKTRESEIDRDYVSRLEHKLARTTAQLKVRATADRGRKLLRESSIPAKLQPTILPLLVGQTEEEMLRTIAYHERLVGSIVAEVGGDGYDRVEGNGSRIREGAYATDQDEDDLFEELGLPVRESASDDDDDEEEDDE